MHDGSSLTVQRRTLGAILSMGVREFAVKSLAFGGWIVLARLLDPATFGIFAVSSFALSLFILLSEVGLGAALIRQPSVSNPELNALFTYQLAWTAPLSLIAVLTAALLPLGELTFVVQSLAVAFLLISLRTAPSIIAQRKLTYAPIVVSDVISQVVYWTIAIVTAFAGWGVWSVIVATLACSLINTVVLYLRVGWLPALNFGWRATHNSLGFSLSYQGQQGASLAKYAMLPLLGGLSAGGSGVGYVTWAHQIAVIPIQLTQLISRVSFPALSQLHQDLPAFAATLRSILKWTCTVTFPACALLIGLAPQIIEFVYGSQWLPALIPFYIFTVNTALNAPVGVLTPALYSLGRSKQALVSLAVMLLVTWLVGIVLAVTGVGLIASAVAFLAGMIAAFYIVVRALRDLGIANLLYPLVRPLITSGAVAVLLQLIAPVLVHDLLVLLVVGGLAFLIMLSLNLWGSYNSLFAYARSFSSRSTKPVSFPDDPQDAPVANR